MLRTPMPLEGGAHRGTARVARGRYARWNTMRPDLAFPRRGGSREATDASGELHAAFVSTRCRRAVRVREADANVGRWGAPLVTAAAAIEILWLP